MGTIFVDRNSRRDVLRVNGLIGKALHDALIALMLQLNGFEPAEHFGVAPSTLKQWRATASCAR
jgi:hypothetical protein